MASIPFLIIQNEIVGKVFFFSLSECMPQYMITYHQFIYTLTFAHRSLKNFLDGPKKTKAQVVFYVLPRICYLFDAIQSNQRFPLDQKSLW